MFALFFVSAPTHPITCADEARPFPPGVIIMESRLVSFSNPRNATIFAHPPFHVLVDRVPAHQLWHADQSLQEHYLATALAANESKPSHRGKTLLTDLQFISANAPGERSLVYDLTCTDMPSWPWPTLRGIWVWFPSSGGG